MSSGSKPIGNFSASWTVGATVYDLIYADVADTASDPNSSVVRVSVNGVTVFQVRKDGAIVKGLMPIRSVSADRTLGLADGFFALYRPTTDTTARTWTIPANASVAFPVGTTIALFNDGSSGDISIPITSDTLVWVPTGATGTRTLAPYGAATLVKVAATRWWISGTGLS